MKDHKSVPLNSQPLPRTTARRSKYTKDTSREKQKGLTVVVSFHHFSDALLRRPNVRNESRLSVTSKSDCYRIDNLAPFYNTRIYRHTRTRANTGMNR